MTSQLQKDLDLVAKYKDKAVKAEQTKKAENPSLPSYPHFWKLKSTPLCTGPGCDPAKAKKPSILTISGYKQAFKKEGPDFVYYRPELVAGRVSQISDLLTRIGKRTSDAEIRRQSYVENDPALESFRTQRAGTRTAASAEDMEMKLSVLYDTVMLVKSHINDVKAAARSGLEGKAPPAKSPKEKKKSEKKSPKPKAEKKSPSAKTPKTTDVFSRFINAVSSKGFNVTDATMKMATKDISWDDASKPVPTFGSGASKVYVRLTTANSAALDRFIREVLDVNSEKHVDLLQPNGSHVSIQAGALARELREYNRNYPGPPVKAPTRERKQALSSAEMMAVRPSRSSPPKAAAPSRSSPVRSSLSPPRRSTTSPVASVAAAEVVAPPRVAAGRARARGRLAASPTE